ncbi:alpha/beta hydrolase [Nocardioides panacisoli]|uniref:AB hydrolase-1 domain-containing protein n=1 Tax=Nocardioides panacisoli TaxID=627624 RepID=A0ABP7IND8_9ACTN
MVAIRPTLAASAAAASLVLAGCGGDDTPSRSGGSPDPAASASTPASAVGHVDIGGRSLHYACVGAPVAGEPTILLLSGGNLGVDSWYPMAEDLGGSHHVCGFDRAGYGASDRAPGSRRTSSDTVDDLMAATSALDLAPPFLLVAHSAGAFEAVLMADRAPELLAGVVLVDPAGSHVDDAARAALPPERPHESPALAEERHFLTVESHDPSLNDEHLDIAASEREVSAALDRPGLLFGDLPVVVLQAPPPPYFRELPDAYVRAVDASADADNRQYAGETTDGTLVHVHHTSHMVMVDQPQAVLDAIDDVLAR